MHGSGMCGVSCVCIACLGATRHDMGCVGCYTHGRGVLVVAHTWMWRVGGVTHTDVVCWWCHTHGHGVFTVSHTRPWRVGGVTLQDVGCWCVTQPAVTHRGAPLTWGSSLGLTMWPWRSMTRYTGIPEMTLGWMNSRRSANSAEAPGNCGFSSRDGKSRCGVTPCHHRDPKATPPPPPKKRAPHRPTHSTLCGQWGGEGWREGEGDGGNGNWGRGDGIWGYGDGICGYGDIGIWGWDMGIWECGDGIWGYGDVGMGYGDMGTGCSDVGTRE